MATEVVMPQMGESIAEGTITKWLVGVGEKVERDQPLFEISTDKVDAEIPSPAAGILLAIHNAAGETVPVNKVVGLIGAAGESGGAAPAAGNLSRCVPGRLDRGIGHPRHTAAPVRHSGRAHRSHRRPAGLRHAGHPQEHDDLFRPGIPNGA